MTNANATENPMTHVTKCYIVNVNHESASFSLGCDGNVYGEGLTPLHAATIVASEFMKKFDPDWDLVANPLLTLSSDHEGSTRRACIHLGEKAVTFEGSWSDEAVEWLNDLRSALKREVFAQ